MLLSIFRPKNSLNVAHCFPPVQLVDSANKDDVSHDTKITDVATAPAKTPDLEAKAPPLCLTKKNCSLLLKNRHPHGQR